MPKKAGRKPGLALAFRNEITDAVEGALAAKDLPSSKDVGALIKALKELNKTISKLPGGRAGRRGRPPKVAAGVRKGKRGRKPSKKGCSVWGCKRPHYAKGLCASHYNSSLRMKKLAAQKARSPKLSMRSGAKIAKVSKTRARSARVERKCTIPGCGRKHYAKGLCSKHYMARLNAAKKAGKA